MHAPLHMHTTGRLAYVEGILEIAAGELPISPIFTDGFNTCLCEGEHVLPRHAKLCHGQPKGAKAMAWAAKAYQGLLVQKMKKVFNVTCCMQLFLHEGGFHKCGSYPM